MWGSVQFICLFFIFSYYYLFIYCRSIKHNPHNTCTVIVTVNDLCEKNDFKATDSHTELYSVC